MNKEIIIDRVDVSGCIHRATNKIGNDIGTYCRCFTESCKNIKNCHYKQLKRKEQECEELKYELILKDVANIELSDEVKKYRKAIDEIEEIADNNYEIAEMEQIFLIIGGLDV